jgi:hypothetical protein
MIEASISLKIISKREPQAASSLGVLLTSLPARKMDVPPLAACRLSSLYALSAD